MAISMHSYFKKDTIRAFDLYTTYYGLPCKSYTDRPLILYVLHIRYDIWLSQPIMKALRLSRQPAFMEKRLLVSSEISTFILR